MKNGFVVHWNGLPARCVGQPHSRCERFWGAVKRYHGEQFGAKWAATSLYSFGVCPHGVVFTGVGWDRNQAANGRDVVGPNDGPDSAWFTVFAFLGEGEKPTGQMIAGVRNLIKQGRDERRCGDRVLPHKDFKFKTCPGPEFTALSRQWDRTPFADTAAISEEQEMNPIVFVIMMYRLFLGRMPESLEVIAKGADHVKAHGQQSYLHVILNSEEYKAKNPE